MPLPSWGIPFFFFYFRLPPAGGLSEDGSSERLVFVFALRCVRSGSHRALLPGLPAPDPGNFLYAQKVTKKAPGRPRTPFVVQLDTCKGDDQLSLKFCKASGSLVIGLAGHALRLTALGLRDFAGFLSGDSLFPIAPGSPTQNLRFAYPFNRASAEVGRETRHRSDARRDW